MDNQKLHYFIYAADYLNFTKAADACHITQATMSRAIASLEDEIGVSLFIRSKNGVTLTKAGQELANRAFSFQEQYVDLVHACQRAHDLPFPTLRIAAGPYEHLLLKNVLRSFVKQYPTAEFNVLTYTYSILASRFIHRSIDFGFCTRECAQSVGRLNMQTIYSQPWQVAAHEDNPFWNLPPNLKRSLYNQHIVTMYQNDFEPVKKYCTANGLYPAEYIVTNFLDSLLLMLETSNCISILPPFVKESISRNIRMEDILEVPFVVDFVAAYDPTNPNTGSKCFFDTCQSYFPK